MSEEKSEKVEKVRNPNWGGVRPGQGRPKKDVRNTSRQVSLPPDLDVRLKKMAAKENVSFSSLIVRLVQLGLESD